MIECSFSSIQYFRQGFGLAVSKFLEHVWRDSGIGGVEWAVTLYIESVNERSGPAERRRKPGRRLGAGAPREEVLFGASHLTPRTGWGPLPRAGCPNSPTHEESQ